MLLQKLIPLLFVITLTACSGARDASSANPLPAGGANTSTVTADTATATEGGQIPVGTIVASGTPAGTVPGSQVTPIASRATTPASASSAVAQPLSAGQHPTSPTLDSLIRGTLAARGLYVFRYAVNNRRLKHLIGISDSTEINALVLDVKDEFGLNFNPSDPLLRKNAGSST